MMRDSSFYLGKEQTYLKHFVLENYLDRLSWIIGYSKGKVCYVDGFSGPWKSGSEDYRDTSIRISLEVLKNTQEGLRKIGKPVEIKCIFVERQEQTFAELQDILEEDTPENIKAVPLKGEFEKLVDRVLSETTGFFTLFFIDPTGWKGYRLSRIDPIVRKRDSELLINFMFDHINRFLKPTIDESVAHYFDELFCDDGAWRRDIPEGFQRQDAILAHYKGCLKKQGGYQHIVNTRILKPTKAQTYFHLIYATRHPKGLREFKAVDCKMQPIQQNIRKEAIYQKEVLRTGQGSMFGAQFVDTESVYVKYRHEKLLELTNVLEEMLAEEGRFMFMDFLLKALEIEMVYEKDVKWIICEAKKCGQIHTPNWRINQRTPKDNTIIERRET